MSNMSDDFSKTEEKQRHKGTENLIPFKPGQSGNPGGRPAGSVSVIAAIRRKFNDTYFDKNNKTRRTYLEAMVEVIFDEAIENKDSKTLMELVPYFDQKKSTKLDIGADKEDLKTLTEIFKKMATHPNESAG